MRSVFAARRAVLVFAVLFAASLPALPWVLSLVYPLAAAAVMPALPEENVRVTIAFIGDVIPHERLVDSARVARTRPGDGENPRGGTAAAAYDFTPILRHVAPYLRAADYAVANLETPLAGPESGYTGFPLFNAPLELALALRQAGIDLCTTANNHCLDRGWSGLVATIDRLAQAGLAHVGTNRSLTESQTPLVVDLKGVHVGFLAYTETLNGHSPPRERGTYAVNRLDVDRVASDAALARLLGAEIVVALVHWGDEYQRQPHARQIAVTRALLESEAVLSRGVDVIIGHHSHVVQPIARVGGLAGGPGKYVAYSLGNFLSNQPWRYSDSGLIAYLHLEKSGFRARVTGLSYLPVYVQRDVSRFPTRYRALPVLPGRETLSDLPLSRAQRARLTQIPAELDPLLFRPEEGVQPLDPSALGLSETPAR